LGGQLYAHAWGIDRTFLGDPYQPKNKSVSHSQILPRDYTLKKEIEVVIQEMGDQIATRLRAEGLKTHCVGLSIGYSLGFIDKNGKRGFHQQKKVPLTNSSKVISELLLRIFNAYYEQQDVRQIGVQCSDLVFTQSFQLNFFEEPEKQLGAQKLDIVVDRIREKYGFEAIIHAHSLLAGGRALERSRLVGGHAGGMAGIEGSEKDEAKKESKNI
jgi:DNA polymerase V